MSAAPAIELDCVTVRFGGKTVLDSFSLAVAPRERVTLAGRSGAGKTTVLRAILGFVVPSEGAVRVEGDELNPETVWQLRRRLAYVAQEPELGAGTVREIIERPFGYRANAHLRANLDRLDALFEKFLLERGLQSEEVTALSGGEKQRVAIISAILLGRTIFLLDEPSSALDNCARDAVADYFRSNSGLTVLAVSHDAGGLGLAGRTVAVSGGAP